MGTTLKAPPITVEQFLNFQAPEGFRDELINGEIVLSPDPKPIHFDICEQIANLLHQADFSKKRWKIAQRVNIKFRDDHSMPSPDVFVIDRAAWIAARETNQYPDVSPVLAVEVVSRANTKKAIKNMVDLYLRNGTAAVWVVYPKRRQIQAHTTSNTTIYGEADALALPQPLTGVIEIAQIFQLD
jgi:Uma2 family endonuclease